MKLKIRLICVVLLLCGVSAMAQSGTLRTVVVEDASGPIIGANVIIQGESVGSSTNIDGECKITCSDDATLEVSYIGYNSQDVAVGARTLIEVTLSEDAQALDEVVIVGYNSIRKAQTTGALSKVDGGKLEMQTSATLENRLQGQTPGVMISSGSGQPGSNDLSIRIRGTGSINGSNTPLYIMDGVMVQSADFAALNTSDIADIQVLKDASATAIYGSRGANGVIVITTKAGQSGKTKITYNTQFGVSLLPNYIDMMNSEENIQYQLQCVQSEPGNTMYPLMQYLDRELNGTASDEDLAILAAARATDTDWIDEMTQTGFVQEHSVAVSNGTDKTKLYLSGSYLTQQGTLKKSGYERYSLRFNVDQKLAKWLDLGVKATAGYGISDFTDPSAGQGRSIWSNPWFTTLLAYPYQSPDDWYNKDNPTLITKYYDRSQGSLKTVGSFSLKAQATDWLSFKTNYGMDFMYNRSVSTLHRDHPNSQLNGGSYSQSASELFRYTWTNTANVNKEFDGGHSLNAVIGTEMFEGKWYSTGFNGYDLNADMMGSPAGIGDKVGASDFPPSISGGRTASNLLSFFGQASYSYQDRYNFSASIRRDTSSKFYKENATAIFWSVGASWLLSSEEWLQDVSWVDLLKVRASYGTTGNQDGVSDFGTFDGYSSSSYNGESGYTQGQLGNKDLRWETSQQTNVGFDFAVLDSRINLKVDLYNIVTKDLYMSKNISLTSGFGSILTNAGSVANRGIEVGINATPISTQDFQWNVGLNYTYNRSEILDLGTWANEENRYLNGNTLYEVGKPLGTWSMPYYAGVSPETGLVEFFDESGERTTDIGKAMRAEHLGSYEVPGFGGFSTNFKYKNVSLDAQFTYAYNYTVMNCAKWFIQNHNFNGNKPTYMLDMWMEPGDVTDVPKYDTSTQPSPMASQFLEDASFIRLKSLRLAWSLPQDWMNQTRFFKGITIFGQGENLVTWTGYEGADPEVSGSYDYMSYPKPITLTVGVNMNF